MKLIGLSIQGLRKIRAAELDFDGKHLVQIRGKNGAGKSTVLDSILYLFKGTKAIPADVVTHGEAKGIIVGQVDGYTIRRVIDPDGKSSLTVEGAEGKMASPQTFLDSLSGQFLDPEWFAKLPSGEKRATLMRYAGIDFTDIDARIAAAEQERLVLGRELKGLGAVPPAPEKAKEVSVSTLLVELNKLHEHNAVQNGRASAIKDKIAEVEQRLRDAIGGATGLENLETTALNEIPEIFYDGKAEIKALPIPEYVDTEELQSQIANAEVTNAKARAYCDYVDKKEAVESKKAEHELAEQLVKALRDEKGEMLSGAKLPISGLAITDTGLAFNGITDNNWSDSEGMKIAIRLAVAYSGDLKAVYVKRGEALDSRALARLKDYAEKEDFQVIVEIVDDSYANGGDNVLYIDEGELVLSRKDGAE